ncbi:zinc ribbon domain-containing protein [Botrimarina hoheduenensis]|uniref:Chromosome partition protein Smc n=1 Tax=Botrimarina hoheduenensis TaxID=2528000 RepID=A0A5C5WE43_9BACT|nr:phospholipase [Botrimarina hoheduenensis]TWT48737.1 Chromosome partition protein Smc [Botrimarina hoheduenensis]
MSTVSAATLRALHRLHSQLSDLREQIDRAPRQLTARQAAVTALEADLAAATQAVTDARRAADNKQLDVKSHEAKLSNWRTQLNSASSNKEYDTLKEQIAAVQMAASVLEDETLDLLERIDGLIGEATRAKSHLEKGRNDFLAFQKQLEERVASARADATRLEADLVATEKDLSGDFVSDYRRLVQGKGAEALAPCEDGVCQGCGHSITANMHSELLMSKPTFCKSCGVLLYVPE